MPRPKTNFCSWNIGGKNLYCITNVLLLLRICMHALQISDLYKPDYQNRSWTPSSIGDSFSVIFLKYNFKHVSLQLSGNNLFRYKHALLDTFDTIIFTLPHYPDLLLLKPHTFILVIYATCFP